MSEYETPANPSLGIFIPFMLWQTSLNSRVVLFKFDDRFTLGSCEHFFHFMWGYLLPAVHFVLTRVTPGWVYQLVSCGPIMDRVLSEVFDNLRVEYCILAGSESTESEHAIFVPRWDMYLLKPMLNEPNPTNHVIKVLLNQLNSHPEIMQECQHFNLKMAIWRVRFSLLYKLNINRTAKDFEGKLLVLKRSDEPEFYNKERGNAVIHGYGVSRRALHNPEFVAETINASGLDALLFEPGVHSLAQQMSAFSQCDAIWAIRGAEFANMLWLKPQARVVLVQPEKLTNPPFQRFLAELLELDFYQIDVCSDFPVLTKEQIMRSVAQ